MKRLVFALCSLLFATSAMAAAMSPVAPGKVVSPKEFLKLSATKGAVVLDVRDKTDPRSFVMDKAIALPANEMTEAKALAVAPDKSAPVLLICNYSLMPKKRAMETRMASAISFAAPELQSYGYQQVYTLENAHTPEAHALLKVHAAKKEHE